MTVLTLIQRKILFASFADKPNRGETQLVIPFSGKGYILGKTGSSPAPGRLITSHAPSKAQDLSSPDHSANAVRPNSKIAVKVEQNGLSKKTSPVSSVLNTSHQNVLNNYFPRVSVTNQKALRSMSGDLSKSSVSLGSQRASPSKVPRRNPSKAVQAASMTTSLYASAPEADVPSKRPRLENNTVFDNFFIKKEPIQSGGKDPKGNSRPTTAMENPSSSSSQSRMVSCPVCRNEVLESQINEHLDWCLTGDSIKIKS